MRVLVTGAAGQVGSAICHAARGRGHEVVAGIHVRPLDVPVHWKGDTARIDLDHALTLRGAVREAEPDWVIHSAAMTNVDECEKDPERAMRENADASQALAEACRDVGARLVHVSTDYVFDGELGDYHEDDEPNPIQAYGRSKLEAERRVLDAHPDGACVARTAIVFSPWHDNFVSWTVDQLRGGRAITLATDQVVTPTLNTDLAAMVLVLAGTDATGVWHVAGATALSRVAIGQAIADAVGADRGLIDECTMADLPWVAPRPRDSSLATAKIARLHEPLSFDDALAAYLGARR